MNTDNGNAENAVSGSLTKQFGKLYEEYLPKVSRAWLLVFQQLLSLVFFVAMFFIAFKFIKLAGTQVSTNMRIPKRWVYWIFPPAFGVFIFQTLVGILKGAQEAKTAQEAKS